MVYIRYLRLDDFIKNQYKIEENNMVDPLKMKVVSTYLTLVGGAVFNIDKISTARYISDVLIRNMYNDDIEIIKGVNENSYIIYLQKALKEVYKVVDRYKKSTYIEALTKYPQWIKMAMRYHLGVTYIMSAMLNINNPLKSVPIYIPSSALIQIANQNIKEETSQLNEEKEINNRSDVLSQDDNKNEDIIKQSEDKNVFNEDLLSNCDDTTFDLDNNNEFEDFDALSILERMMG